MFRIPDNSSRNIPDEELNHLDNFKKISQFKINTKDVENSNLLIFSNQKEKISNEKIFDLNETKLTTNNMMGFVGLNGSEITIHSRFAKGQEDYFLHYMLQKVFSINIFDLKHSSTDENIFDFLLYLFPYYLKKALRQGLYKKYKRNEYNNSNIKGSVNISQHIRTNIPFLGKIAYSVREHSYDNKITQLIRHTIEFITKHKFAFNILTSDSETQNYVREIVQATPTFDKNRKVLIINNNLRPLVHPYFSEYKELQKICLQILRYENLKYGYEKDQIYGLLFDGAWLWEEYLNTILKDCGFKHPRNDILKGGIYLFEKPKSYIRYPDFWKDNFIIDAKYKRLNNGISRHDMNQIISYMYVKRAESGGFLFPIANDKKVEDKEIGILNGYGGKVKTWALSIPQKAETFGKFCSKILENEKILKENINEMSKKEYATF